MSASPIARQAHSHAQIIPAKTVLITDASQLPDLYSSTPGGTLYSTTPGGTRIIYERAFLMNLRNSPLSRTPPSNPLPQALMRGEPNTPLAHHHNNHHHHHYHHNHHHKKSPLSKSPPISAVSDPEEQFDMDI